MKSAVDDDRTADAAADIVVDDNSLAPPAAEPRFGHARAVGIVGQQHGQPHRLATPVGQGEILPAFDLMTDDRPSALGVDRTAETDADPAHAVSLGKRLCDPHDLPTDFFRAKLRLHREAFKGRQGASVASANAALQFRSADFNAQEHGKWSVAGG